MKTIIAISGPERVGKSSSIADWFKSVNLQNSTILYPSTGKIRTEVVAYGTYVNSNGISLSKTVGVNSYGDNSSMITKYVNKLIQIGCEVIISACHEEDDPTFKALVSLAQQYNYQLIITSHYFNYIAPQNRMTRTKTMGNPHILNGVDLNSIFASHLSNLINQVI